MITVVVPTITGRHDLLQRALASITGQTLPAVVEVEPDPDRDGAAATRNRALARVDTEWVAFLDDDDELKPTHLEDCLAHAQQTGADVVYPGCDVIAQPSWTGRGHHNPSWRFGQPFDPDVLRRHNFIPVTTLCRTGLVKAVGGFQVHPDPVGFPCEDWGLWLAMLDAGARFSHLAKRTWVWTVHTGNTFGRGTNR